VSLVIAAGGDGTVCAAANGLIQSRVPLGILPLGTGNGLARVLGIPLNLDQALEVLSGEHVIIGADALRVGERHFFLNVSAGISPQMMSETKSEQKKRFGRLAYVWTMIKRSSIFQLRRYQLTIDDRIQWVNASEILISNTTLLDKPPHVFGPPETLNDGRLEVYLVTAHSLGDYLRLFWEVFSRPGQPAAKLQHLAANRCVSIQSAGHPRLLQADGEVIGHTPVEVELIPTAIHLIRPNAAPA
jgi:diacylglycerol kinase family enzyme